MSSDLPVISNPMSNPLMRAGEQFEQSVRNRAANDQAGLRQAANEFESLFVSYLLKVMRETIDQSTEEGTGFGREIYTELFDQEVSRGIAQKGVLGIADMLVRHMGSDKAAEPVSAPTTGTPDSGEDIPDFQLPVRAPVSSGFGVRRDPFTHTLKSHKGIDIAAPEGTVVQAALAGEVVKARYEPGYGNTVVIRHADGLETRYAHLGTVTVKEGERVPSLRVIGSVGNTGRSTGPHLHFEVISRGMPINPEEALAD
jgi:murein DD-endopeptidase MepM/ murein hydrolase activator NlpD